MVHPERYALALAAVVLTTAVAACGSGSSSQGTTGGGAGAGAAITGAGAAAQQGGKLTVLSAADVDYLDPGQSYYVFGLMVSTAVNRQLYYYKPGDSQSADARPGHGAAEDLARRQDDHRQHPARASATRPPVDREVVAGDVKYAMERAFSANVPSGYALSYFKTIVGAPQKPGADPPDPGHPGARRAHARHQAHEARGRRSSPRRWPCRSRCRCRRSTRRSSTARRRPTTTSTSPSPARTWSSTTSRRAW